jgi:hypothetical protein
MVELRRRLPDVELDRDLRRARCPEPLSQVVICGERRDMRCEFRPIGGGEKQPRLTLGNQFRNARDPRGDNRLAEGHRFHEDDRQSFHEAWQHQDVAARDLRERFRLGQTANKADVIGKFQLFDGKIQFGPHGSITDDHQVRPAFGRDQRQRFQKAGNAFLS